MSSVSRNRESLPPIESLANRDGELEDPATYVSSGTDTKSDAESDDATDRASTPPGSRDQSSRAPSPRSDLIPNPGFSQVRSWLRVPVPAGRDAEMDVVKVSFVAKSRIKLR